MDQPQRNRPYMTSSKTGSSQSARLRSLRIEYPDSPAAATPSQELDATRFVIEWDTRARSYAYV